MGDITFHINVILIGFAGLAVLLLIVNLAIAWLRAVARRQAMQNDLEQIGQEAVVIKTIRSGKPGQIRYHTQEGLRQAPAEADSTIRNGHVVIIQSVAQNRFRVRLLTAEELANVQHRQAADSGNIRGGSAAQGDVGEPQPGDTVHSNLAEPVSAGEDPVP